MDAFPRQIELETDIPQHRLVQLQRQVAEFFDQIIVDEQFPFM